MFFIQCTHLYACEDIWQSKAILIGPTKCLLVATSHTPAAATLSEELGHGRLAPRYLSYVYFSLRNFPKRSGSNYSELFDHRTNNERTPQPR